jgi:hypothetical protein
MSVIHLNSKESLLKHVADVVFVVLFVGVAMLAIIRPDFIVSWAKRAHPELSEDDNAILWIARLIGVGGLVFSIFFLVIVLRSF